MIRETRIVSAELRVDDADGTHPKIIGHAAVFDSNSETLNFFGVAFVERIDRKAFDGARMDDVRALYNHNPDKILGRTPTTLQVGIDNRGVAYINDPPNTSYARDLLEVMRRGDVDRSSFAFSLVHGEDDEWDLKSEIPVRTIKRIRVLHDVSPVVYPAYPDADSGLRGRATSSMDAVAIERSYRSAVERAKPKVRTRLLAAMGKI